MNEIVYVLINEAMPGYVKVGFTTTSIQQRLKELDTTSAPLPFECYYAAKLKLRNAREIEKLLHDAFLNNRVRSNREFFQISPDRIVAALKIAELEEITPKEDFFESEEDKKALQDARERKSSFNFEAAKIPLGAEIFFVKNESIKAKVVASSGKKTIELNGEVTSLSDAAWKLLGYKYKPQGTIYWKYEGKTLADRRESIESGEI
ncbi:MAG: hypothetical protein JWM20_492 [Patescibacteria group bacterium]|nr:hypothetical protein [Patescibacteria group bacterium]